MSQFANYKVFPISHISFGLFAAEELISTSGTAIPADGLIEIITLDENGKSTDAVDDLIIKFGHAPKRKFKVIEKEKDCRESR